MMCRVCGGGRLAVCVDLGMQPHGHNFIARADARKKEPRYPLRACFCRDCTAVQIDYTVPKEVMFGEFLYLSGTTETLCAHFAESTKRLTRKLRLAKGDLVVDIGSNDGTWLRYYRNTGLRALGIECAKNIARIANRRGLETWPVFFNRQVARDIKRKEGEARLVTAAGVFFHLEELHSVTEGVAELIGNKGVLCVQAIYLGEMVRNGAFDQIYHEHLLYWTLRSLERLLSRYGLEVFAVRPLQIHGGSVEYLIAKKGTREVEPSVGAMRRREARLGLGLLSTYRRFGKRVEALKGTLLPMLRRFRADGKRVFALGAPIKGVTLLNSLGITAELVECAVEINPLKVGKYLPGVRIPVRDERAAGAPDAYLVLAWNFLPELLRKMEAYIRSGGTFIVPIPKPIVITGKNYKQYLQ